MGSIILPTSELLGGIGDVLPVISDPKDNSLAGFALEWKPNYRVDNGDVLTFTAYDIHSGATVDWVPGEGDESDTEAGPKGEKFDDETPWGGDADHFRIFVDYADAKEIVKIFKVPAKLWRTPVRIKVNAIGTKLTIERDDSVKGERLLTVACAPHMLQYIPDVRAIATAQDVTPADSFDALGYPPARLAALASARPHDVMRIVPNQADEPTQITMGDRYAAFLYRSSAKGVTAYRQNMLRDGAGVHTSGQGDSLEEPF